MRVLMATAGALVLAAAAAAPLASATPVSAEDKPASPTVQPNPASPGARIWVYDANKCTASSGTATSQALAAPIALAPLADMTGGGGTLRTGLAAGTYTITLHCGSTLTATLHVEAHNSGRTATTPTGAAATGDGSAEDHLGIGDAAVGSAFLVGGVAFAAASFIRRRRATPRR